MRAAISRRLSYGALACALVLALGVPAQAQTAPERFAGMDAAVQPYVDQGEISGAVMLVADKDRVLHLSAVGKSDLATGRAMKTDDIPEISATVPASTCWMP